MASQASPGGVVLGIDTASGAPSLALLREERVIATRAWEARETMSRELLAALDAFLREAGVPRGSLAAIAVNMGPGQYGALRTGVATAQGIAQSLDVPLAGVARLEADAYPRLRAGRVVVAVHDAGRSGYAWAAYEHGGEGAPPLEIGPPRLDDAAGLADRAPGGATWCGEIGDALLDALNERRGEIEVAPAPVPARAVSIVRLALLHQAFGDPALVDVTYLRPPPITQPRAAG